MQKIRTQPGNFPKENCPKTFLAGIGVILFHTCCNITVSEWVHFQSFWHLIFFINKYKSKRKLRLCPSLCERSGILLNVLESQPTFSWCVPPLSAFYPLKHVESRGLRSSCSFLWRLHPSLLELCNSRGFRIVGRSFYVKLNPLKSPINMVSVYIMEVSLIDRQVLLPLSACRQRPLLWNGTEETGLRSFHYP